MHFRRGDFSRGAFRVTSHLDDRLLRNLALFSGGGTFLEVAFCVGRDVGVCLLYVFLGFLRCCFCQVKGLLVVVRRSLFASCLISGGADQLVDPLVLVGVEKKVERRIFGPLRRVICVGLHDYQGQGGFDLQGRLFPLFCRFRGLFLVDRICFVGRRRGEYQLLACFLGGFIVLVEDFGRIYRVGRSVYVDRY